MVDLTKIWDEVKARHKEQSKIEGKQIPNPNPGKKTEEPDERGEVNGVISKRG